MGIRSTNLRYMDSWTLSRANCSFESRSSILIRFFCSCLATKATIKPISINPAWCISYRQIINRSWIIPYFDSRIESFALSNFI